MKFYVSTTRLKRVSIPGAAASGGGGGGRFWQVMKGKISPQTAVNRRICHRTVVMPAILLLGLLLPFLFVRIAFLVLESATVCSSSIECMKWKFFGGSNATLLQFLVPGIQCQSLNVRSATYPAIRLHPQSNCLPQLKVSMNVRSAMYNLENSCDLESFNLLCEADDKSFIKRLDRLVAGNLEVGRW